MLKASSADGQLVSVALNTHGTRAVQKLVETLTSREQVRPTRPTPQRREAPRDKGRAGGCSTACLSNPAVPPPRHAATQVQLATDALKPGVVALIRDLNGNHVVQRCLQRLGPEDSGFIYEAAAAHCVDVATHRHGCCVLQRCIDYATNAQKRALVERVAEHSLMLAQVHSWRGVEHCV